MVVEITMATPKAEMVAVAVVMVTINQEILRLAGFAKVGPVFLFTFVDQIRHMSASLYKGYPCTIVLYKGYPCTT